MQKFKTVLLAYGCLGLISVFVLWVISTFFPTRDIFDLPQQDIPLRWYEYARLVLGGSLIPSLITSCMLITRNTKRLWLPGAFLLIFNSIAVYLFFVLEGLSHIDCGDNCANYIPSYHSIYVMTTLLVIMWVAPALAILIAGIGLKRRLSN